MMPSPYTTRVARLSGDLPQLLPQWRQAAVRRSPRLLSRDPDWLLDRYSAGEGYVEGREDVFAVFLARDEQPVGVATFLLLRWPIHCVLGELSLTRLPFRRACPPLSDFDIPEDHDAYDRVFSAMALHANSFDAIYFEDLRADSPLATYLGESAVVREHYTVHRPEPPSHHSLIHIPESLDEYLSKFSGKTRGTLRRKVRKLDERGAVKLTRVTQPRDVDAFVTAAERVSRGSYQYNLLGLGMRDAAQERRQLHFWASHGWLRSYLLEVDGVACCYLIGIQDERCFHYWDVAQDTDWNKLNVGTVLQYKVLEDLCSHKSPELFDFGSGPGDHKQFFENDSYQGIDVYLVPKRPYPRLALAAYQGTQQLTDRISGLLDRFELKNRVRRAIRSASVAARRISPGR